MPDLSSFLMKYYGLDEVFDEVMSGYWGREILVAFEVLRK